MTQMRHSGPDGTAGNLLWLRERALLDSASKTVGLWIGGIMCIYMACRPSSLPPLLFVLGRRPFSGGPFPKPRGERWKRSKTYGMSREKILESTIGIASVIMNTTSVSSGRGAALPRWSVSCLTGRSWCWIALAWALALRGVFGAGSPPFVFNCRPDNDLYRLSTNYWPDARRYDDLEAALAHTPAGGGLFVLADGYPALPTVVSSNHFAAAAQKQIRLYVEFPAALPGLSVATPRETEWERSVVSSDVFSPRLTKFSIVAIHGCRYVPVQTDGPAHLVVAKVAGFDRAVFGLPPSVQPILFEHPNGHILVATTKLSQFHTARYAPKEAWQAIWAMVFNWLQPGATIPALDWTPQVRPSYGPDDPLPADAVVQAVVRGIDWHTRARLLLHPSWTNEYPQYGNLANPIGPRPNSEWPSGDGEFGLLEGFNSRVFPDGTQNVRWWLRSDCNGESALSFALRSRMDGDLRSRKIGSNLLDWVYFNSGLLHNDPGQANFGLLGWAPNTLGTYFQDNDIKAILGGIGTAALLLTDRWDEPLLKNILANFRTTGIYGFRGECLNEAGLQKNGWEHYWRVPTLHLSAHFEVWSWAGYLWLYDKTHFAPLLERVKTGVTRMMAAYPDQWLWTNGIQQERGRMLLTLAWLVRVEDTPQHRAWLKRVATDLISDQVPSGAIREEMGELRLGYMRPPQSNEAYGTGEAPLIHQNGDPVADLLYTCNFALLGLHEAEAATGDLLYGMAKRRLIEFLLRVQVQSRTHPEFDGAWFRAFDFRRWDYFASNSDWGWGAWAVECGWTQGWITTGLALHSLQLNLWDLSKSSRIADLLPKLRPILLPDDALVYEPAGAKVSHDGVGKPVVSFTPPDSRYPGLGALQLTDGRVATADLLGLWLGYEGANCQVVVDLGEVTTLHRLEVSCLQQLAMGIYLPARLEFAVSPDGVSFESLPAVEEGPTLSLEGPEGRVIGLTNLDVTGRFVRANLSPLPTIPPGQPGAGRKPWLFVDEILVNRRGQTNSPSN